jgi:hypothetical protein
MPNCLINNGLGGGIPMGINCTALPVYLFPYRLRYVNDDFVFKKSSFSDHLLLIYTQVTWN